MDSVAPAAGLSPDLFSEEGLSAWVGEQLGLLDEMQAMGQRVLEMLTERMKLGGARLGSMAQAFAQLARAMRLGIALAVRLRQWRLALLRGERDSLGADVPAAAAPPAAPAAAAPAVTVTPRGANKAMILTRAAETLMRAATPALSKRMASLYDRMGPEEFGEEFRGWSNVKLYRTMCRLLGVTPDPALFVEPETVDRAPAEAAVPVAPEAGGASHARLATGAQAARPADQAGGWRTGRGPP